MTFILVWDNINADMDKAEIILEKVFSFVEKHHMLKSGDRVIAGVSGGADSVCLLLVLTELQKRMPLSIGVVHVNHGIRPEAGEDARYVEELCREYEIPFYLVEKDVHREALILKCSEEEAGRRVRYDAFSRIAEEFGADRIAVAHNSNDQSETMLFHLFRGSGLKGLSGIPPVRERIIRPILCLERKEIEEYLSEREVSYCTDATNYEDGYTRNRIRHHILPYAEKEIVSGCVAHMAQTAQMLSETEDYLEEQTKEAIKTCVRETDGSYHIDVELLRKQHIVIQKRVLFTLTKNLSPHKKDISNIHIRDLMTLADREGNRMICLPCGITGRREYDRMILERKTFEIPGRSDVLEGREIFRFTFLKNSFGKSKEVPQNEYTKWFDYDKIKGSLEIRTRRQGDYLTIADGRGGLIHQSLKDYMINHKIPAGERDQIPVLAEGSHVVWLAGYRISEYYKIDENTQNILQVQLMRNI